tara:strand:- start:1231 stop:1410 length:180 start_codon:yes stop_codon:yes gene_type:complete
MSRKLPELPSGVESEVRSMDSILLEMQEITVSLALEADRIRDQLEQKFEAEMQEEYGDV